MRLLAIDRSTAVTSLALAADGKVTGRVFEHEDTRGADWPAQTRDFLAACGVACNALDRIVVGTGPGSFAGIRGALAFAQGLAIGIRSQRAALAGDPVVYGLPSAAALAPEEGLTAVVGDARRKLFWVVVYEGMRRVADFRLVGESELEGAVPQTARVVTPDGARIGETLSARFGARFEGCGIPRAERLAEIALAQPETLVPEPLPIYLSPAVRG